MFDSKEYDELINKLEHLGELPEKKQRKLFRKLFKNEEFLHWFFCPSAGNTPATPNMTRKLYNSLIKFKTIKAMTEALEEGDYDFDRTVACVVHNIALVAASSNADKSEALVNSRKRGDISDKEAKNLGEKIEIYGKYVADFLKAGRRIVKRRAKDLAAMSNLPKDTCINAYFTIPDPKHIDKYRVGKYLNMLMDLVYADVASGAVPHVADVKWKPFFKEIFGKDNYNEIATFILLQGVNRIDKFRDEEYFRVKKCWDQLTSMALNELNTATDNVREQMLELYLKRVDKMFQNRSIDLRVNLLELGNEFPNLVKTVQKYSDKLMKLLERPKATSSAKVIKEDIMSEDDDD